MSPLKVLGIYREQKYSNRAVSTDKAIMDDVLSSLKMKIGRAAAITVIRPEFISLLALDFHFDLVFSMAQDEDILSALDRLEKNGAVVVNSSKAIRNCYRKKLSQLLSEAGLSYPDYLTINVSEQYLSNHMSSPSGYWLKRGDFHALVDEDVFHIDDLSELPEALLTFKNRGVSEVILQKNCEGELYKFYGVKDSYFNLRYMGKTTTDRYKFSPIPAEFDMNIKKLEEEVNLAARILGLDFFGGDCIVSSSGEMHFIDFNDWPSFRTCSKVVAPLMANYALEKFNREGSSDYSINQ